MMKCFALVFWRHVHYKIAFYYFQLPLKSIPWTLAEFYFNRGLQRPDTGTCTILQKMVNGFLCLLIVFLKSKTHQLNFEGRG